MIFETEVALSPEDAADETSIKKLVASRLNLKPEEISAFNILKRSIDARGRMPLFRMHIRVFTGEFPLQEKKKEITPATPCKGTVIIVGAGPAGLFAALRCLEIGLKPIVLERGKDVKERRRDLARINKEGIVDPDSNYCFGEGGAGTYSDGKLYTRSNKRGDVNMVLETFVAHGASPDILVDARPHIGTNKLPQIITSIREKILKGGGEIRFNSKLTGLIISNGIMKGIVINEQDELIAEKVILATGHSARDIFYMLDAAGLQIEAKPFALGVRIEHPQEIIDQAQYHCRVRGPFLPPSYYSLVEQVDKRGVFSFCMCPGGIIAPCATENDEIVVNGWSPSKRNNPFANSGTVVQVDIDDVTGSDPFKLLRFQAEIERASWLAGGGKQVAPAQRMVDFVNGRISRDLPANSYIPGTSSIDISSFLPGFISNRLKKALPAFGKKMPGYYTNEALIVATESRTSSPVRIPRSRATLQHHQVKGLYPCGEGAGYAGGIVSAAIDGMNCADACMNND